MKSFRNANKKYKLNNYKNIYILNLSVKCMSLALSNKFISNLLKNQNIIMCVVCQYCVFSI